MAQYSQVDEPLSFGAYRARPSSRTSYPDEELPPSVPPKPSAATPGSDSEGVITVNPPGRRRYRDTPPVLDLLAATQQDTNPSGSRRRYRDISTVITASNGSMKADVKPAPSLSATKSAFLKLFKRKQNRENNNAPQQSSSTASSSDIFDAAHTPEIPIPTLLPDNLSMVSIQGIISYPLSNGHDASFHDKLNQDVSSPRINHWSGSSVGSSPTYRISFIPFAGSRPAFGFDPISVDFKDGDKALRVGRFTNREGNNLSASYSSKSHTLSIKSKVVSRAHAEIWLGEAGIFFIKDMSSSSGTFLNHNRLSPANKESAPCQLIDGDTLQFGIDYRGAKEDKHKSVKVKVKIDMVAEELEMEEVQGEQDWDAGASPFITTPLKNQEDKDYYSFEKAFNTSVLTMHKKGSTNTWTEDENAFEGSNALSGDVDLLGEYKDNGDVDASPKDEDGNISIEDSKEGSVSTNEEDDVLEDDDNALTKQVDVDAPVKEKDDDIDDDKRLTRQSDVDALVKEKDDDIDYHGRLTKQSDVDALVKEKDDDIDDHERLTKDGGNNSLQEDDQVSMKHAHAGALEDSDNLTKHDSSSVLPKAENGNFSTKHEESNIVPEHKDTNFVTEPEDDTVLGKSTDGDVLTKDEGNISIKGEVNNALEDDDKVLTKSEEGKLEALTNPGNNTILEAVSNENGKTSIDHHQGASLLDTGLSQIWTIITRYLSQENRPSSAQAMELFSLLSPLVQHNFPSGSSLFKAYLCKIFSIESADVLDLTGHIDRKYMVAAGGSGEVYKASWVGLDKDGSTDTPKELPTVVAKLVRLPPLKDEVSKNKRYKRVKRELELWSKLHHPHILPLVGIARLEGDANLPAFVSPWMEDGNVMEFLKQNPSFQASKFLTEIIKGLHYLHTFEPVIVHGDIKGANVLINHRKEACLCDFGLSRFVADNTLWRTTATHANGTLHWMAPELIEGDMITPTVATDIYAYGMTCYEILSGQAPFGPVNEATVIRKVIYKQRPERMASCHNDQIWSIITRCWVHEPEARPSTEGILAQIS